MNDIIKSITIIICDIIIMMVTLHLPASLHNQLGSPDTFKAVIIIYDIIIIIMYHHHHYLWHHNSNTYLPICITSLVASILTTFFPSLNIIISLNIIDHDNIEKLNNDDILKENYDDDDKHTHADDDDDDDCDFDHSQKESLLVLMFMIVESLKT